MKRAPAAPFVLVALATVLGTASAQTRRPMLGTVVDEAGEPVANATVHAAYVPSGAPEGRASDLRQATTDARGRFRIDVSPATKYRLWAIGPVQADGYRASEVHYASQGQLVELRVSEARPLSVVEIEGVGAWADAGPLRLRAAPARVPMFDALTDIAEDGTARLPPLPDGYSQLDVLDRNGEPLTSLRVMAPIDTEKALQLAPPQNVPMRAVDANGKPVQGVRIRQRISAGWSSDGGLGPASPQRHIWRVLGTTDADGMLTAVVSAKEDPLTATGWRNMFFVGDKEGCCDTHSGFTDHPFFDGKEIGDDKATELKFTMRADEPIVGRILRSEDAPLAGLPVTVRIGVKVESKEGNGWRHESYLHHATTDEDGRFRVRGGTRLRDEIAVELPDAEVLRELLPEELRRMSPREPLALERMTSYPKDGFELCLTEFATLQMQLLDQTGGPASDAEILLLNEVNGDFECGSWTPTARTDNAGRVAMLLQPGRWFVFARNETGYAYETIHIRRASSSKQLDLQLAPMPAMHGRVVDADGKPLANARVRIHSSSWSSGRQADKGLAAVGSDLNWNWVGRTRSDENGMFAIRYLEVAGFSYEAKVQLDKRTSDSFRVELNETPQTFVIE